jgi:hypothetical protein
LAKQEFSEKRKLEIQKEKVKELRAKLAKFRAEEYAIIGMIKVLDSLMHFRNTDKTQIFTISKKKPHLLPQEKMYFLRRN